MPQWGLDGGHTCRRLARGTGARCVRVRVRKQNLPLPYGVSSDALVLRGLQGQGSSTVNTRPGKGQPVGSGATYQLVDAVDGTVVLVTQPLHAFKAEKGKGKARLSLELGT